MTVTTELSGRPLIRLRLIAPIRLSPESLGTRLLRYREIAGARFDVRLDNLTGPDAPRALDDHDAVQASIACVRAQAIAVDPADTDLVMPDCVLDPGVDPTAAAPRVPMLGILHLVAGHLAGLQRRFSAVTRNDVIADELVRKLQEYGHHRSLVGVDVIHGGVELISDEDEWIRRLDNVVRDRRAGGVRTVFNGCSAVGIPDHLRSPADPDGTAVIDPTALALQLILVAADSGLLGGSSVAAARANGRAVMPG